MNILLHFLRIFEKGTLYKKAFRFSEGVLSQKPREKEGQKGGGLCHIKEVALSKGQSQAYPGAWPK